MIFVCVFLYLMALNEVGTTENQPGYPIFQQTQMQIEITINHWDLT